MRTEPVRFEPLAPDRPAAGIEEELLARWTSEDLFARTLAAREGSEEFVFYEGPPTANGRPGIHHVFSRTLKDLFCRHRAMRGYHVTRKAGWDTHGLPVEIEVEKQLAERIARERGLTADEVRRIGGKQLIEEIGVERFNRLCRDSVWTYRGDWERLSARIGYWLDYDDPYITYSNDYIESVWWALRTLHEKGLLTRGHKVLPYCARCGTALSSHEVAQGYEDVADPSVYVALDLVAPAVENGGCAGRAEDAGGAASGGRDRSRRRLLVWTTTPWTLVSNVALAVHPELEYAELRRTEAGGATDTARDSVIVAASRAGAVLGDDYAERWTVLRTMRGSELEGARYRRPLDWVTYGDGANEIIVAERFVSADEGTGIVHVAPAFGADDYAAGQRHGLVFVQPVNARGEFPADMPVVGGRFVKDADGPIIDELRARGVLWKAATLTHSYPHCWRCGTPLLYCARTSWFIRTTAVRDAMLARNARVDWHPPETGERRFGEWLTNNIDWAISRDRYWGTPLPVWTCDRDSEHVDVIGGYADLEERTGRPLDADFDPHKPFIDAFEWTCRIAGCGGTQRRVPEVIDAWFDSGSMAFAQWHYPFEGRESVQRLYPADLIAEGVDQTRGWFYSLLAIATGLDDALPNNGAASAAPYRAVVVNDLVLDANGQKMSKSRGNVVEPWPVLAQHGADSVRLFLVSASQVWLPRRFDEGALRETTGRFLLTFKNIYSGSFALYANFGWAPSQADPPAGSRPLVDRWILSRLAIVEDLADASLEQYDAYTAARAIMDFIVSDVSQWYVRLNRPRFYDVDGDDNRAAFATLHEVLVVCCRLLAPLAPFVSDWIHRELTGESVHLAAYVRPRGSRAAIDRNLDVAMAAIRELSTLARAAREEAGVRVRQPLSRLVCVAPGIPEPDLEALLPLLAAELNVKRVDIAASGDALVTLEAKANYRSLGRKFGPATPEAASAIAALSSDALRAFERAEPVTVNVGKEAHTLDPDDLVIVRRAAGPLVVKESGGFFAALDATVTPALGREGIARELTSRVQRLRKEAGLAVSDRILLAVAGSPEVESAVREHETRIAYETLALEIRVGDPADAEYHANATVDIHDTAVRIALTRTDQDAIK
ncbi:MAG: isoleucine--tRNA ligase [Gemmatimonadaceae bacterium]